MGYKRAGYEVVLANDIDPEMAWHYRQNLRPKHYVLAPINQLVDKWPAQLSHDVDLLDGSPPCSTFSQSGNREKDWGKHKHFREGQAKQVLDDLFFDWINVVEAVRPRAAVAENVTGLIKGNAKGYVRMIFERLRAIGYKPQLFLLDASRCGVAQKRQRVFVVAQREDLARPALKITSSTPLLSARAAVADLVLTDRERTDTMMSRSVAAFWPLTVRGQTGKMTNERRGTGSSFFNLYRVDGDKPSPTLASGSAHQMLHWDEPRTLSAREWLRLSSFPDDYFAKTAKLSIYMCGMSVPPKMAEVVAAAVRDQWLC